MRDGPRRFPQGFTCPVVLGNQIQGVRAVFAYGALTRSGGPFQILRLTVGLVTPRRVRSSSDPAPQHPIGNACGLSRRSSLGSSPFARRYLGNRGCFLFLEVLRCFSSLGSLLPTYGFSRKMSGHDPTQVPPFGHPRISACLRLPEAFRSLTRPSSAPGAKASTVSPCSLDY